MKRSTRVLIVFLLILITIIVIMNILPIEITYALGWLITIANLIIAFFIASSRKKFDSKLTWIVIILFLPIIGIVFYFLFGQHYTSTKHYRRNKKYDDSLIRAWEDKTVYPRSFKAKLRHELDLIKLIDTLTYQQIYFNTKTEILKNGDVKFRELFDCLKKAQKFIHMQYYIIRDGDIANELKDILIEKAHEGVEIRLLYDSVGAMDLSKKYINDLTEAGIHIEPFNPINFAIIQDNLNYRNHRKNVVIDGRIGFLGGINIGDEYNHKDEYYGFWRDTHLYLEGDAVKSLHLSFIQDWYFTTKEDLLKDKYLTVESNGNTTRSGVQIISDGPDQNKTVIKDIYFKAIMEAQKNIMVATPYLIPDADIVKALKVAAMSGVRVQILIPGKPDKKLPYYATESYFEDLLEAGVEIYKYNNNFMHSKILIIDDKIASIGTANLDFRSFNLNFEITAILYLDESIKQLITDFKDDLKVSKQIIKKEWVKRPYYKRYLEAFAHIFSPLL